MQEARYEATGGGTTPKGDVRNTSVTGSDDDFPDRAWTLPRWLDLANSLKVATANQDEIVITHVVRSRPGHGMTKPRSGLAPWQERRAKEMLAANLNGDVTIADMAAACRLSQSHFSQSFKRSVGCPPHQWLLKQRIERAKQLMLATDQALSEIALDVGFAGQSHFTRVFSQHLGASPAAWRRAQER